ncbi:uncharacterized protein LOC143180083 [Calliopsis andreniformis]|uniref:uncharacterized protein LOC143180083 n=1 Tax=Calliopsis andreniformis TaxID=337506 RepID=UPI003FCCE4C2
MVLRSVTSPRLIEPVHTCLRVYACARASTCNFNLCACLHSTSYAYSNREGLHRGRGRTISDWHVVLLGFISARESAASGSWSLFWASLGPDSADAERRNFQKKRNELETRVGNEFHRHVARVLWDLGPRRLVATLSVWGELVSTRVIEFLT